MNNRKQAWCLDSIKARSEQLAQQNLNRQSYTTYLPLAKSKRRRNGQYINQIETLFPGYLFIQFDSVTNNWSPIRTTRDIAGLIRFRGVPQPPSIEQKPIPVYCDGTNIRDWLYVRDHCSGTFVTDRPGHDWRYAFNATKMNDELGWKPAETFETGIRKTVAWYHQ